MQVVVLEAVVVGDMLEHPALVQAWAVEQRLPAVPRQAHSHQPLHQLAAQERAHHTPVSTPVCVACVFERKMQEEIMKNLFC